MKRLDLEYRNRFLIDKYFSKMHQAIGVPFSWDECQKEDWFLKHTWTREQELDFKVWLVGEMRKDFKISRKRAINEADWFILDFGWKTKGDK